MRHASLSKLALELSEMTVLSLHHLTLYVMFHWQQFDINTNSTVNDIKL